MDSRVSAMKITKGGRAPLVGKGPYLPKMPRTFAKTAASSTKPT